MLNVINCPAFVDIKQTLHYKEQSKYNQKDVYWTLGLGRNGPMKESVLPSVLPSFCKFSRDWPISFF